MSVQPWCSRSEWVKVPEVVGTWNPLDSDGNVRPELALTFAADESGGYTLSMVEAATPELIRTFDWHFFRLKNQLFFEFVEGSSYYKGQDQGSDTFRWPVYMVGQVAVEKDRVIMRLLDDDWVEDALEANPGLLRHEKTEKHPLLTASTAALQQFLADNMNDKKAFELDYNMRRAPSGKVK
jgi:hypothetical protein